MKVTAEFMDLFPNSLFKKVDFTGPAVMSLNPIDQINDDWFAPIAAMYSKFESYALRAEKMFDALMTLGGPDLVVKMLNVGQALSKDLGCAMGNYTHGLTQAFEIYGGMNNLSMTAVHFTDWVFQMAMDEGELGRLDFEHQEFDELIQSLRDELNKYRATCKDS